MIEKIQNPLVFLIGLDYQSLLEDWDPWDLIDNQIQPEQPEKGLFWVYPDHPEKGWLQMDKRRNLYLLYGQMYALQKKRYVTWFQYV